MFCQNCGAIVDVDYKFCRRCGSVLDRTKSISIESNTQDVSVKSSGDPLWRRMRGGQRPSVFVSVLMIIVGVIACWIGYSIFDASTIQQFLSLRGAEYAEIYGHSDLSLEQLIMAIGGAVTDVFGIAMIYIGLVACLDRVKPANRQKSSTAKIIAVILCALAFATMVAVHCLVLGNENWRPSIWDYLLICAICRAIWKVVVGSKIGKGNLNRDNVSNAIRKSIVIISMFVIVALIIVISFVIYNKNQSKNCLLQQSRPFVDSRNEELSAKSKIVSRDATSVNRGFDFSKMSNEELERLAAMAPEADEEEDEYARLERKFAGVSDEELARLAAMAPEAEEEEDEDARLLRKYEGVSDEELDWLAAMAPKDFAKDVSDTHQTIYDNSGKKTISKDENVSISGVNKRDLKNSIAGYKNKWYNRKGPFRGWITFRIPGFMQLDIPPTLDVAEDVLQYTDINKENVVVNINLFGHKFIAQSTAQVERESRGEASITIEAFSISKESVDLLQNLTGKNLKYLEDKLLHNLQLEFQNNNEWTMQKFNSIVPICLEGLYGYRSSYLKSSKKEGVVYVERNYFGYKTVLYKITFVCDDSAPAHEFWNGQFESIKRRIKFYR